jgi:predicted porin
MKKTAFATMAFAAMATSSLAHASTDMPSQEEMWKLIQKQQKQIEALTTQASEADDKIDATSVLVENVQATGTGGGLGWWNKTQIGGYGELHYNGLKDDSNDTVDFHRFVLFVSHDFTSDIRFFSELELEHSLSGDGKPGEVELEQAFVEFDLNDKHQARAGLFLLPVGILNENHEPPSFFGVERNPVEKNIIPTTWWEAGLGLNGQISDGFSYDVVVHSGLAVDTTGSKAFKVRDGREKVAKAQADKGAFTGRIKWTGMPGVELAATAQYQQDVTQADTNESASATLFETHADIRKGNWGFRALYARWDVNGTAAKAVGRDEQTGWYVEPSYRFDTDLGEVGVFARYNEYDNEAGNSTDTEYAQIDFGVNYWPHKDVVLKADMQFNENPDGKKDDEILNLGVGFQF